MPGLTDKKIKDTASDDELFQLLCRELERLVPPRLMAHPDAFVQAITSLPVGLRSMAAVYQFDVSMTLDDLGFHFSNWHHKGYAQETLSGLVELGANEEAEIFAGAMKIAFANWAFFTAEDFVARYYDSPLDKAFEPLNNRLWELMGSNGRSLLDLWAPYPRRYPIRVCRSSA